MSDPNITPELRSELIRAQRNEITEYHIYRRLAGRTKDPHNSRVLAGIGEDEKRHADFFAGITGVEARPFRGKIFRFYWIARLFGLTFGVKLMEKEEEAAQIDYKAIARHIPEAMEIKKEEEEHERELVDLLEEERLAYMGSVVLGLNDALVELTGALAGLTFALRDPRLIAVAGLITGIAASFSMAASEYLSQKSEGKGERAKKSALYTGIAYLCTVFALILPYLLVPNPFFALPISLAVAVAIIAAFNYYISVAQDLSFGRRFGEMTLVSLGVAAFSFVVGIVIRTVFGIDV